MFNKFSLYSKNTTPTKSGDSLMNLPEKMYIFASRLHPKKEGKCNILQKLVLFYKRGAISEKICIIIIVREIRYKNLTYK